MGVDEKWEEAMEKLSSTEDGPIVILQKDEAQALSQKLGETMHECRLYFHKIKEQAKELKTDRSTIKTLAKCLAKKRR